MNKKWGQKNQQKFKTSGGTKKKGEKKTSKKLKKWA